MAKLAQEAEKGGLLDTQKEEIREEEEEEIPLEIVDYSCNTPFEEEADTVERFLRQVHSSQRSSSSSKMPAQESESSSAAEKPQILSKSFYAGVSEGEDSADGRGRKLLIEVYFNATPAEHSIAQTFAPLKDFVVLTHEYDLYSSSDSTILLSILCCGMEKSGLFLPCFVPTGDVHRLTYIGRYHSVTGFCTRYSMQAERTVPPQCQSVSGLLDLFHLNVGLQSKVPHGETVLVDSESDYSAAGNTGEEWDLLVKSENNQLSSRCPPSPSFGTRKDPIKSYSITCSWRGIDEKDVVDTTVRSTFNPYGGSTAGGSAGPSSVSLKLNLRSILDYSEYAGNTIDDVNRILFLGNVTDDDDEEGHGDGSSSSFSPNRSGAVKKKNSGGSKDEETATGSEGILSALCAGVLADPVVNTSDWRDNQQKILKKEEGALHRDDVEAIYPPGSLFSRFAHMCTLTEGISGGGKIKAIESLWAGFIISGLQKEMDRAAAGQESSWMEIVAATFPSGNEREVDHNCCLVHQKLQLLHICGASMMASSPTGILSKKKRRDTSAGTGWGQEAEEDLFDNDSSSSDDDQEKKKASNADEEAKEQQDKGEISTSPAELKITLLRDPTKRILAPPPQHPTPRCSDQIEKEEADLTALGTSSAAKSTRMWMQKGQLVSDVAAFKALNGGTATFADFVHWHSKSDFTSSPSSTHDGANQPNINEKDFALYLDHVSERMRLKGNIWLSVWETTLPALNVPHFNPMEEIATTMQWLKDLPKSNRLLFRQWISAYTFSNAFHRMRRHSLFSLSTSTTTAPASEVSSSHTTPISPLVSLGQRTGRSIGNGLRGLELDWRHLASHSTTENSIVSFSEQGEVWELYRAKRKQLESLEILLSIGVSIQSKLVGATSSSGSADYRQKGENSDRANKDGKEEANNDVKQVLVALLAEAADEGRDGAPGLDSVPLPLWKSHFAINLLPPTSLLPPYQPPKPLRRRHTIRAKVERPMNCPAHNQMLHASVDEQETFRIGLALSESLI